MNLANAIRNRRLELKLKDVDVARSSGLSIHEYADIEQHADEIETAVSMGAAKRVLHTLELDVRKLLGLPPLKSELSDISDFLRKAREHQKLSKGQLAKRIGFDEHTVTSLEEVAGFLDTLPLNVVYELESALALERGFLVRE